MRSPKTDTVFQLSLTELAFILIFVVLLLIGSKFVIVGREQAECEQQKDACYAQLPKILADPNAALTELANVPKLREENAELQSQLAKTTERLKALESLEAKMPDAVEIAKAREFMEGYEEAHGKKLPSIQTKDIGKKLGGLGKDLTNCQGQLNHCVKATKGYGLPPCWVDENDQIEYMFDVTIHADGVRVNGVWPPRREQEVAAMPAVNETAAVRSMDLPKFKELTAPIFRASKAANPECRHYVILRRDPNMRDIDRFNLIRLGVEDFFYKNDRTGIATR